MRKDKKLTGKLKNSTTENWTDQKRNSKYQSAFGCQKRKRCSRDYIAKTTVAETERKGKEWLGHSNCQSSGRKCCWYSGLQKAETIWS